MPAKRPSAKYLARATAFAEAVDIGLTIAKAGPDIAWQDWEELFKRPAIEPEPVFATLKSLAYLEDAFFTYWNEASGEHVERFWERVAKRGLPFERKHLVREVLARGRIRTEMEYQAIVDCLVMLQPLGRITDAEADRLGKMMSRFEQQHASRLKRNRSR
jgi:hypothetical protein